MRTLFSLSLSFFLSFVYLLNLLFEPYRLHLLLPRREIFERVRSFHSVERFAVQLVQVSQRVDVFLVILATISSGIWSFPYGFSLISSGLPKTTSIDWRFGKTPRLPKNRLKTPRLNERP